MLCSLYLTILLQINFMSTIIIKTVECGPKLGHILFDPLSLENSQTYAENIAKSKGGSSNNMKHKKRNPSPVIHSETGKKVILQDEEQELNLSKKISMEINKALEVTTFRANELVKQTISEHRLRISSPNNHVSDRTKNTVEKTDSENIETEEDLDWLENKEIVKSKPIIKQISHVSNKSIHGLEKMPSFRDDLISKPFSKKTSDMTLVFKDISRKRETLKREVITPQETITKILRSAASTSKEEPESRNKTCGGYDYDETICRYFGKRYLCGYNKNVGDVKESDEIEDLGNGCRNHGDRLECGYQLGSNDKDDSTPNANENTKHHFQKLTSKMPLQFARQAYEITTKLAQRANPNQNIDSTQTVKMDYAAQKAKTDETKVQSKQTVETNASVRIAQRTKTSTYPGVAQVETSTYKQIDQTIGSRRAFDEKIFKRKKICFEKGDRIVCYDIEI